MSSFKAPIIEGMASHCCFPALPGSLHSHSFLQGDKTHVQTWAIIKTRLNDIQPSLQLFVSGFSNLANAPDSPHLMGAAEDAFAGELCCPPLGSLRLIGPEMDSATDGPCLPGVMPLPLGLKPAYRLDSLNCGLHHLLALRVPGDGQGALPQTLPA